VNVLEFLITDSSPLVAVSRAAPFYAGISAWTIELLVAGLILYGLRREEKKVFARRAASKSNDSSAEEAPAETGLTEPPADTGLTEEAPAETGLTEEAPAEEDK